MNTRETEDKYLIPFFNKIPLSIERGEGVYVWDEEGNRFMDFTSGWGVTSIGHAHPVIINAITEQSRKIIQNPNAGLTYSPPRAKLLELMSGVLPGGLTHMFFTNSGAEANDAAIKLARKVSGRKEVIATNKGFHGRTISTASATGQAKHREKFNPLMPGYKFVPFNDIGKLKDTLNRETAAVILEPVQGEGGVNLPVEDYLFEVAKLCEENGTYLIVDEIQTGFYRTGPMFAISDLDIRVDFMTMAKGIAGGFPLGAFAVSDEIAGKIEKGDHGGTYCGNPLGCAVACAVIRYLVDNRIGEHVTAIGNRAMDQLKSWQELYPREIESIRGKGLLLAMEFFESDVAMEVYKTCLEENLMVNITQEKIIRLLPALTITRKEMEEGLSILKNVIEKVVS
jgi:acetylornithine/N-succinyldiaminopimelate aminotransferase